MVKELKKLEGVEDAVYEREGMEQLDRMKRVAFLVGGLIAAVSMVVIAFSIMLTVYARREELAILRLLGATYGYIRIPLLLQGFLEGLIGSGLGLLLLYALYLQYGASIGFVSFLKPEQMGHRGGWRDAGRDAGRHGAAPQAYPRDALNLSRRYAA